MSQKSWIRTVLSDPVTIQPGVRITGIPHDQAPLVPQADTWTLSCDTHGRRKWQFHMMCDACGCLYQHKDRTQPRYAQDRCSCGRRFLPAADPAIDFTARPICYLCFRRVVQHANGIVPRGHWTPERDYSKEPTDPQPT